MTGENSRLIDEQLAAALERAVSPRQAKKIVASALQIAGQDHVPPENLDWFVDEPLRVALWHFLDATGVRSALEAVTEAIDASRATQPPAGEWQEEQIVLVASRDVGSIRSLRARLQSAATVVAITTVGDLAESLNFPSDQYIIVLDACAKVFEPDAAANVIRQSSSHPRVIVWGDDRRSAPDWLTVASTTTADGVADLVTTLFSGAPGVSASSVVR